MNRRLVESTLGLALLSCAASCASAPASRVLPPAPGPSSAITEPSAMALATSEPSPTATMATPATASAPSASASVPISGPPPGLPPPRPATIRLSSAGGSEPGDPALTAGDRAFESGNLAEAQRNYEIARSAAPRSPGPVVGLIRVRIARVDVPLDYAAAKGNAAIAAAGRELALATKAAPGFGPAFVELGRSRLLLGDAAGAIDALRKAAKLLPDEPEAHS